MSPNGTRVLSPLLRLVALGLALVLAPGCFFDNGDEVLVLTPFGSFVFHKDPPPETADAPFTSLGGSLFNTEEIDGCQELLAQAEAFKAGCGAPGTDLDVFLDMDNQANLSADELVMVMAFVKAATGAASQRPVVAAAAPDTDLPWAEVRELELDGSSDFSTAHVQATISDDAAPGTYQVFAALALRDGGGFDPDTVSDYEVFDLFVLE